MTAAIIDGNAVGNRIKEELKADVERLVRREYVLEEGEQDTPIAENPSVGVI